MMKLKVLATISLLIFSCVCGFCQDKGQEECVFSYKNENRPMFDNDDTGAKFREWIDSHVRYPKALKKEGIQGRVAVGFTITRQGRLTDVKVYKGVHPLLDKEAVRVVRRAPQKWTCGRNFKGDPIDVHMTCRVDFTL